MYVRVCSDCINGMQICVHRYQTGRTNSCTCNMQVHYTIFHPLIPLRLPSAELGNARITGWYDAMEIPQPPSPQIPITPLFAHLLSSSPLSDPLFLPPTVIITDDL